MKKQFNRILALSGMMAAIFVQAVPAMAVEYAEIVNIASRQRMTVGTPIKNSYTPMNTEVDGNLSTQNFYIDDAVDMDGAVGKASYRIKSEITNYKSCADIAMKDLRQGGVLIHFPCMEDAIHTNQLFTFIGYANPGGRSFRYQIQAVHSGLCLSESARNAAGFTQVVQTACNPKDEAQLWRVKLHAANGTVRDFRPRH